MPEPGAKPPRRAGRRAFLLERGWVPVWEEGAERESWRAPEQADPWFYTLATATAEARAREESAEAFEARIERARQRGRERAASTKQLLAGRDYEDKGRRKDAR